MGAMITSIPGFSGFSARLVAAAGLGLALALVPAPASAQAYMDTEALEYFFEVLKAAPDPLSAEMVTAEIWYVWTHPDDPELAAAMIQVLAVRAGGDYHHCIELLDAMVVRWPDYAEGWNQRATIHYILHNFEASLADVEETLAREPRHFGALSGAAAIYLQLDNRPAALGMVLRGLQIHPFLNERRYFPELLEPEVAI
ncbi:MAG: hypothetical protein WEB63_07740 [Cucumibacter sp.]